MAGHSQFKNIMHRKGAQDAKRAKIFTKIIRELTVAAREGGSDPHSNSRLKSAMLSARESNMPKDTMDRAIKRGEGGEDDANYEEIRYEGYGPGGVAVLVECLTDNRNRTAAEVRSTFTKCGGNFGETGSVSFMFDHLGLVRYPEKTASFDEMFEVAVELGAEDVKIEEGFYEIYSASDSFSAVRDGLIEKFGDPESARLTWIPKTITALSGDEAKSYLKFMDTLEDNDDVQSVFDNGDVPESLMAEFT
ncbi:MAG: YebC/PmpR family DNA-binding transcriptional regulator [Alphaproteobacteria bacterium 16-39-46]|nr:MAG: YebC/PmpR family DNA-binding transcriptional regulator [Alphaproteobacteria bacterium 16-39-46]OZA42661.1 MAG: YebC/PmpR family DNA-binding transcriptional regulator [Alphaproteobacteria bacterium 17-39-52]HQS84358.1 YebC/PmpR family DNA-binding transcriptional regulator [Alphaproteobacteria bacterium]HQS94196.1 YebC/PmpR family DNA-binding transcriptional regulator [Alphaproteobacteria bacterium]